MSELPCHECIVLAACRARLGNTHMINIKDLLNCVHLTNYINRFQIEDVPQDVINFNRYQDVQEKQLHNAYNYLKNGELPL